MQVQIWTLFEYFGTNEGRISCLILVTVIDSGTTESKCSGVHFEPEQTVPTYETLASHYMIHSFQWLSMQIRMRVESACS